jgi:hypothetical protein
VWATRRSSSRIRPIFSTSGGGGDDALLQVDPGPPEAEDLFAADARQEEEPHRAAVACRVEAGDERADLVVGEDARPSSLVLLVQNARGVLFHEAAPDRPSGEPTNGAQSAVASGRSCRGEDDSLDVLGRDLGEQLLAEHPLEPVDVGECGPGRAAVESVPPPTQETLLLILEPGGDRLLDRLAEPPASSSLSLGASLGLGVLASSGASAGDGSQLAGGGEADLGVLSDAIAPGLALEEVADEPDHVPASDAQHKAALIGVDPLRVPVGTQAGEPGGRHSDLRHRERASLAERSTRGDKPGTNSSRDHLKSSRIP